MPSSAHPTRGRGRRSPRSPGRRRIEYNEVNDVPAFYATKENLDLWPFNQMPTLELEDGTRLAQQVSTIRMTCRFFAKMASLSLRAST